MIVGSAGWILADMGSACDALALGIPTLLLAATRNAWDLVTWLPPARGELARMEQER